MKQAVAMWRYLAKHRARIDEAVDSCFDPQAHGPSGQEQLFFAFRSSRRALLTPQANPGSCYRCGKST